MFSHVDTHNRYDCYLDTTDSFLGLHHTNRFGRLTTFCCELSGAEVTGAEQNAFYQHLFVVGITQSDCQHQSPIHLHFTQQQPVLKLHKCNGLEKTGMKVNTLIKSKIMNQRISSQDADKVAVLS